MSKFIGALTNLSVKKDIVSDVASKPNLEMMGNEVNSMFVRDVKSFTSVPVDKRVMAEKPKPPDINKESNFVPRTVPKAKDGDSVFVFSDLIAQSTGKKEYEISQKGHSARNVSHETGSDGTKVTRWDGVNQEKTAYIAEAKDKGNTLEISSSGKNGEFEANTKITREGFGATKETVTVKNNKTGTESSYTVEARGGDEKQTGFARNSEGTVTKYSLEKSRGIVNSETVRTEFIDGGIEMRETVKEMEHMINTLAHFSDTSMEEMVKLDFTEKEAIETLAKNIKEGKISTAKIKKEIYEENQYLTSMWDDGSLLELIEQEFALSLDDKNKPVFSRSKKIYDKEGNLTGEEEEETFYRKGQGEGERERVIVRRTYEFIEDERVQTGEEEFIDFFPGKGKKNLQFTRTYFHSGKKFYQRTDRIEKGDVSEEYRDLSDIMETGRKLLFARLLEGKAGEISIRHHRVIFYSSIETEEKEFRATIYKTIENPGVMLMRMDLPAGYSSVLPLWVITVFSGDEINTQYLFEGSKDATFIDRYDRTNSYHSFRGTLKGEELSREILREASGFQHYQDDEAGKKIIGEERSHLEYKFSDKAWGVFNIQTPGWLDQYSPPKWMKKDKETSLAEMLESIIYFLFKYLAHENSHRREVALEKRNTFIPIIASGKGSLEILLGQKFGIDLVFLLWEMLNIVGYAEDKEQFVRIKV